MREYLTSSMYERTCLESTANGIERTRRPEGRDLVVSLTTIPERIHNIHITIESLFQQSVKANRVILWLPRDRFAAKDVSALLKRQENRGLEIAFCSEDLGPYTKYYYCLEKYPDDLIVTVDDDRIYPVDTLDLLVRAYEHDPSRIYCHRAHRITLDSHGKARPYRQWEWSIKDSNADVRVFPTGVGGVIYHPGCFHEDVLNKGLFLKLSPKADDVWLKAMSLKKGILCQHVFDARDWSSRCIQVSNTQMVKLKRTNKSKDDGNDKKINAVFDHYDLLRMLAI